MEKAWLYFKDLIIMSLGLLAFTTGTYYSVHDIIHRFSMDEPVITVESITEWSNSTMTTLFANMTTAYNNSSL